MHGNVLLTLNFPYINISLIPGNFYISPSCFYFNPRTTVIMRIVYIVLVTILTIPLSFGQQEERNWLRGKVLYKNVNVPNQNVINTTTEKATITNDRGEFAIRAKEGDELVFSSVNYQLVILDVTAEMMRKRRLVLEVEEKVTALDEVVVSPEDQQRFIELRNEEFKQYEYETDETAEVVNVALDPTVRGMQDGLNFVNIFKALFLAGEGKSDAERRELKPSEVLRQVYDDQFFVENLNIPQDKIDEFLVYCDSKLTTQSLLRKDNEFQLIDFLVNQSKAFLALQDAKD